MGSSSGNSSGSSSSQLQNSGSEESLQILMDQRKRKRMESNRESARRSRMRKQQHLDDLMKQVGELKKENAQIVSKISITTQHCVNFEFENSVLRAQLGELSQRLQSLNDILAYMNTNTNTSSIGGFGGFEIGIGEEEEEEDVVGINQNDSFINNPWNLIYLNQPIMASPDMLHHQY